MPKSQIIHWLMNPLKYFQNYFSEKIVKHCNFNSQNIPVMVVIIATAATPQNTVIKIALKRISKYSFDSLARTYSTNANI